MNDEVSDKTDAPAPSAPPKWEKQLFIAGWAIAIIGMAVWIYGLYAPGGYTVVDWETHTPSWVAEFLPNWLSEVGLVFSMVGMVPVYYVQIRQWRQSR